MNPQRSNTQFFFEIWLLIFASECLGVSEFAFAFATVSLRPQCTQVVHWLSITHLLSYFTQSVSSFFSVCSCSLASCALVSLSFILALSCMRVSLPTLLSHSLPLSLFIYPSCSRLFPLFLTCFLSPERWKLTGWFSEVPPYSLLRQTLRLKCLTNFSCFSSRKCGVVRQNQLLIRKSRGAQAPHFLRRLWLSISELSVLRVTLPLWTNAWGSVCGRTLQATTPTPPPLYVREDGTIRFFPQC